MRRKAATVRGEASASDRASGITEGTLRDGTVIPLERPGGGFTRSHQLGRVGGLKSTMKEKTGNAIAYENTSLASMFRRY